LWFMVLILLGFCLRCSCDFSSFLHFHCVWLFFGHNVHCLQCSLCLRCPLFTMFMCLLALSFSWL
jgi:hypothetical protein